ncbi:MAG: tRNA preQ1(34) S-adenosylmethionine ribosyltransferase-isomerase QueA [Xanthomonadales bacterium]|nr:tRNA preQ1(34) S-adenosylmethionine ribosyltransferase-isomerase QueA [Xanthomonadales bacterium]
MRRTDFTFDLPEELIAQHPVEPRSASRLLVLDRASGQLADRRFAELDQYLEPGDLLVFNDTRVVNARLFGTKATGGKIEILVERVEYECLALAQVRASKSPKPGSTLLIEGTPVKVLERAGEFFRLESQGQGFDRLMEQHGHVPLPPYIRREDRPDDLERYQTVYASNPGAVAAPTAGLHFDQALLERLKNKGVRFNYVTLHVGAGTFQPMRAEQVTDHKMHSERVTVSPETCQAVQDTRRSGQRVVAVGTTTVRSLEAAFDGEQVQPFAGETDLFLYPGKPVNSIDLMITNFHLPESTLLMLVSAFAGKDSVMGAYRHAVEQRYRFFSYGDAMLIGDFRGAV